MNLIIDQGNTRTKIALFDNGELMRTTVLKEVSAREVEYWLGEALPQKAIVASVVSDALYLELQDHFSFAISNLTHATSLPFSMKYKTPETLGLDRIALAAAAVSTYPAQDCLVIDAGTCITYDFVNRLGEYEGGAIAPGLQMRFKSLDHFTARLPMGETENLQDLIGTTTRESIASGVINGIRNEVEGTINQYQSRFPEMITVLTGGDAGIFDSFTKNSIFAAPEFLLKGLNNILDYHAETL